MSVVIPVEEGEQTFEQKVEWLAERVRKLAQAYIKDPTGLKRMQNVANYISELKRPDSRLTGHGVVDVPPEGRTKPS